MDEHQEFRKLADDPEFAVCVDFGGCFFDVFIGPRGHGYRASTRTRTFAAAIEWLQTQARELYPRSRYVQRLRAGADSLPPMAEAAHHA